MNQYIGTPELVAVQTCYIPQYTPGLFGGHVKLFTDNGTYDSRNYIPEYLYRAPGNYSWRLELIEYNGAGGEVKSYGYYNFTVCFAIRAQCNFNGGVINIDGQQVPNGTCVPKLPGESIYISAVDQQNGSLYKVWDSGSQWMHYTTTWVPLNICTRDFSFVVSSHDNCKNFLGYMSSIPNWPTSNPRTITFSSTPTGYIQLSWNEHPNTSVSQYQIWRKTNTDAPELIGTVNRGTTSFVDTRFRSNGSCTVYYDVRAYYSPELTTSYESWVSTTGLDTQIDKKGTSENEKLAYSINNYPNPFNPSTRIEFQLPAGGFTTLKIYNSLGRELATLVNEYKNEGKYSTEFNAASFSSGMYFCELRSGSFVQMKKMLLMK